MLFAPAAVRRRLARQPRPGDPARPVRRADRRVPDRHLAIPGLPELIARYRGLQDRPGFAPVRRALLEHDVLALRLDEARGLLAKLDEADAPLRQAAEATLCFLAGENAEAIGLYRAALKELRKQAGKRKLFLEGAHGLFFLMALLRANDAALHAEIQAGIDVLPLDERPHPGGWVALQVLLWLAQGLEGKAREQITRLQDYPGRPTRSRMPASRWPRMRSIRTFSRKPATADAARFAAREGHCCRCRRGSMPKSSPMWRQRRRPTRPSWTPPRPPVA